MTKKYLNQNDKYVNDLINSIEPDFFFASKPINRFKTVIDKYETTIYAEEAFHRLVEIYYTIGLKEEAKNMAEFAKNNSSKKNSTIRQFF